MCVSACYHIHLTYTVTRPFYNKQTAIKEEEKVAFTKAETVRKAKERAEKAKQITVEDLTIAVVKYRELGLDFVKGEGTDLQFAFTKIDPNDHDRVFSFFLQITDDELYQVKECCPQLEDKVVMGFVDELNRCDDYPSFMRGMRKAFKDSIVESTHEERGPKFV